MKKIFLIVALLLGSCPLFGQSTVGYHRTSQVLTRAPQSITAQVVPNAKIAVTNTATGTAATIYSDPLLTSLINPPLLTADNSGNYSYYIPLSYCVTETISSPGQSQPIVIPNICVNSSGGTVLGLDASGVPVVPVAGVFNFTATSPIVLTPSGNTFNFSCPSCSVSSGGTSVTVNGGSALGNLAINGATPSADSGYLALLPKISGSNMIVEAPYATTSSYGVTENLTLTTTGTSGPATLSGYSLNIPNYASGGGGSPVSVVLRANPSGISGSQQTYDAVSSITPVCDIRAYGAQINDSTPIDSAVQACIAVLNSQWGATGIILLPCVRQNSTGPGCYLQNSSTLTGPSSGTVTFRLQGGLGLGSTLVAYNWGSWFGDGGNTPGQFQTDSVPAAIFGPAVNGFLGTVISTPNTATNITPTFSQGGIANLPVGSAITIAGARTSSATASRVASISPGGYGYTTYTYSDSTLRIPPGETVSVSGCVDTSFNGGNLAVSASDYTKQTVAVYQTSTSVTSTTGCTISGFNEDLYESARILCSNGVGGTFNGVLYNSCSTGQVTIMTSHAHSSLDAWGEVAVAPAFNTYNPQTWSDLAIYNSYGMGFWSEGGSNLVLNHMFIQASAVITSGALELSANYLSQIHGGYFETSAYGQSVPACPNGGCQQPSYPYGIRCDADAPVGSYYSAEVSGCDADVIDGEPWIVGGVKIDGSGYEGVNGFPKRIESINFEEGWGSLITIDNRFTIQARNTLFIKDAYNQDNISAAQQYLVGYTDGNLGPSGNISVISGDFVGEIANPYFNPLGFANDLTVGAYRNFPANGTASSGVYNEGNLLAGEHEGEGEGFGPQSVPYGSLPMANFTLAAVQAYCTSVGSCSAATAVGPDGPSGSMTSMELDTTTIDRHFAIGTDTRATYAGDHYLIGSHVRPGTGEVVTQGVIAGTIGQGNSFYLTANGSDQYAVGANSDGTKLTCAPSAFGTQLNSNGWGAQVAICTILVGDSTSHATSYYLAATNGGAGSTTVGNQYADPFWVFIPGPNNPACSAAGTCLLTADQIEEARRDQYHGFVPPNMASGVAVTGEQVIASSFEVLSGTKAIYRCSGGTSDGYLVVASSTQATACTTGGGTLVLTGITTL